MENFQQISQQFDRINCAACVCKGKNILIVQRSKDKKFLPNKWHLPGGKIDEGETPEVALVRELNEELGFENPTVYGDTGVVHDYVGHGSDKSRTMFFAVTCDDDITLNEESQNYAWVGFNEIETYMVESDVQRTKEIFKRAMELVRR